MPQKITAITPQKRNPRRVNVYLDGKFAFGLEKVVAAWLQIGQTLTEEEIADLRQADAREAAYQQALRYCAYRPRTEQEVRRHLAKHGVDEAVVEEILQRLRELSLVDDARFAREWVESRAVFRPRGIWALRQEMLAKGLPAEVVEEALAQVDEEALAKKALEKALRRYRQLPWQEMRRKIAAYLARRGFSSETVNAALNDLQRQIQPNSTSATPAEDNPP